MVRTKAEQKTQVRSAMRGGKGDISLRALFSEEEMLGRARLCSVITVEPGCSIGAHAHDPDFEIYYVLEGELKMDDNGTERVLRAGDAMLTKNGESHDVENRTNKAARLLAIVIN